MTTSQPNQTVHDPICHMDIDIRTAAGSSDHEGKTYYFCSPGCKKDFDEDPQGALQAEAAYDHSKPSEMEMEMAMATPAPAARPEPPSKPWWQFWR